MQTQTIVSRQSGHILFQDKFESLKLGLEQAVADGIDLSGADLSNLNLSNACLDDGLFDNADFTGSNLTGANMSETKLRDAIFDECDLVNTCFAYADMPSCSFRGATFGATDISCADISRGLFFSASCFSLDFANCKAMTDCIFIGEDGKSFTASRPPVTIRGVTKRAIVLADECWMHGMTILPYPQEFYPLRFLDQIVKVTG